MNELIARALLGQFTSLVEGRLLTTAVGLVKTLETDAYTTDGKSAQTMPVPYRMDSRLPDDWKLLLPDTTKTAILYFEDGGYTSQRIGGIMQVQSRLTLVCWFNGDRVSGVTRERLSNILVNKLCPVARTVPTTEPGIAALQVVGCTNNTNDPFVKYSGYNSLFNFKNSPYGWLALDLSLRAYVTTGCLV